MVPAWMPSLLLPHHAEVTSPSSPAITHCHLSAPAVTLPMPISPAPTHGLPVPSTTSQLLPAPSPHVSIPATLGTTLHDLIPCPYLSRSPCGWWGTSQLRALLSLPLSLALLSAQDTCCLQLTRALCAQSADPAACFVVAAKYSLPEPFPLSPAAMHAAEQQSSRATGAHAAPRCIAARCCCTAHTQTHCRKSLCEEGWQRLTCRASWLRSEGLSLYSASMSNSSISPLVCWVGIWVVIFQQSSLCFYF